MYIFELTRPGSWLTGIPDPERQRDVQALLDLLTTCLEDAAISLSLFEQAAAEARASDLQRRDDIETTWDAERAREHRIQSELEAQLPDDLASSDWFDVRTRIMRQSLVEAKRERWCEGSIPKSYRSRVRVLHAKSCLYAFDTIAKSLKLLKEMPESHEGMARACSIFSDAFPGLVGVRDSSHHAEDRVQAKKRANRIELQPLINSAIHAPQGGVLFVNSIFDNRFGGTLADGTFGEIEISTESVAIAQQVVQLALDGFQWEGPASHLPH
ncbi:hypothetical protein AB0O52_17735 [Arthrobacter sp. NPDC080073]|uniref:hypothetical protein n=1 Tax=Arthrobacter sp. NPDC080073 TaxID=3155919 RepID=UPI00343EE6D5